MTNILLHCLECGSIYKIIDKKGNWLVTDLNGKIKLHKGSCVCMHCRNTFEYENNSMNTPEWIANLVFKIKG